MKTNHVSWYVNVGQVLGIGGGLLLGFKALDIEAKKAGIEHRPLKEVLYEDVIRVKHWVSDTFGPTRQYRHY